MCVFIKALVFFIKGQHHPKSVFNSGPKVGPALNEKTISIRFLFWVSTAKWKTTKTQRGGALRVPPLWCGTEGAALLFSSWQWKPGIKNLMEIGFL